MADGVWNERGLYQVQDGGSGGGGEEKVEPLVLDVYGGMLAQAVLEGRTDHLVRGGSERPGYADSNMVALTIIMKRAGETRVRLIRMMEDSLDDTVNLTAQFKRSPTTIHEYARINIMKIATDPDLSGEQKLVYVRKFVEGYINLIIELDHRAFPQDDVIKEGVPEYIPDGLSDMGRDPRLDGGRYRKNIRVRKRELYNECMDFILEIFSKPTSPNDILRRTMRYIHDGRTYHEEADELAGAIGWGQRTVDIHGMRDRSGEKFGVCRHDALNFQALMQLFGFECRLLKCRLNGPRGHHAANLVRIGGTWYLVDTTNPYPDGSPFIIKLSESDIDLNGRDYVWRCPGIANGAERVYENERKMFYRIRPHEASVLYDSDELFSDALFPPEDDDDYADDDDYGHDPFGPPDTA